MTESFDQTSFPLNADEKKQLGIGSDHYGTVTLCLHCGFVISREECGERMSSGFVTGHLCVKGKDK